MGEGACLRRVDGERRGPGAVVAGRNDAAVARRGRWLPGDRQGTVGGDEPRLRLSDPAEDDVNG